MEDKTWGCLKQAAIGCGVLLVIAVALPFVLGVMMMGPFKRAVDTRMTIEERFGPQEAYVPPPTGAPAPDRIESFLAVRRGLSAQCADLTDAENQVRKLESFDDQDEVDRIEVLKQAFSTTRSMMGVGPLIGQFYETRNQSLLDAEMGLGEFTYIFVLAYNDRLLEEPQGETLFGPRITNQRVRRALLSMLDSQLEALQSQGGEETDIEKLAAETAAVESNGKRIPWQDGLPSPIIESLAPFRTELDELFCPAMAPLELMINERHGPAIESR